MSWVGAAIYDRLTRQSEEACLQEWRAALLADATGHVLEAGAGTGANLLHYTPAVNRLVLAEPDLHMRRKLIKKLAESDRKNVEVINAPLEALTVPDASFDFVVCTLVLCSVTNISASLAEVYRVLKPGGGFVFLEHVAAEDRPNRLKWQRRIEPFWKRLAGNCHLTRRTATAITNAGFVIDDLIKESMRKASPIFRPTVRGIAWKSVANE